MRTRYFLFFVLFASCCFMSCKSGMSSLKDTISQNKMIEEELMKRTTIERLILMQEGSFVFLDSTVSKSFTVESRDSLMLYSKQFGDIHKDGYWLYQKMYMSSLRNAPLSIDFIKINRISRDSFSVQQFAGGEEFNDADMQPEILEQVDFDKLVSVECDLLYEKKGQLEFKGKTPICVHEYHEGGVVQIFSNNFHITTEGIRLITTYYRKDGDKNIPESTGHCFLKRQ